MDGGRGPCLVASLGRPVLGPSMKDTFAEFGYDDRKGVGACDRGPSGLGNARVGLETRLANSESKQEPSPTCTTHKEDGAHEMCRLPKSSSHTRILNYL